MTTPQTRDDGLSAEDEPGDDERAKRVLIRLREMQNHQGEDYIWRTAKEAADVIAALLSHKQQGRNEGLEEAAQICSEQGAIFRGDTERYHGFSNGCGFCARLISNAIDVQSDQAKTDSRALISPLPKAE